MVRSGAVGAHRRVACIFVHVCTRRGSLILLGAHGEYGERGMSWSPMISFAIVPPQRCLLPCPYYQPIRLSCPCAEEAAPTGWTAE